MFTCFLRGEEVDFRPPDERERLKAIGSLEGLPLSLKSVFIPGESFDPIPTPGPNDWLATQPEEGQTFREFVESPHNVPDGKRNKIYLQPLGDFSKGGSPSLELLKKYTEAFFMMEVKLLPPLNIEDLNLTSRRSPYTNNRQILTTDILDLLKSNLPSDAFCFTGITMEDLYPHPSWNFVFGQASMIERVGIYSFARYDPAFYGNRRQEDYGKILLWRSCKVLAHELCHQFGISHCIYYHCVMNGSNHLEESDARPHHLCPVDLRKLFYSIGFDVRKRYSRLLDFYIENDFEDEAEWIRNRLKDI